MSPVSANAEALKVEGEKATKVNTERGRAKGTRVKVGQTRGKSPSVITWEAFDLEIPESLPTTPKEFMDMTGTKDEKELTALLIDGFNSAAYSQASDEIGEFVEDYWDKDTVAQFRVVVRTYAKGAGMSIEDSVGLIKPGFEKAFQTRKSATTA